MNKMSEKGRLFAEVHHKIVFAFLRDKQLNVDEFYDVVILRYLNAVERYLSEESLRKYSFTTIAYAAMSSAVYNYRKSEKRRREMCPIINTEFINQLAISSQRPAESTESKLLWAEIATYLTGMELEIINRRAAGATNQEIAEDFHLARSTISAQISKIRRRILQKLSSSNLNHDGKF